MSEITETEREREHLDIALPQQWVEADGLQQKPRGLL
jgi:hypothetical protein